MSAGRVELSSELVDWLTEAVVLPDDPQLRAERICAIVEAVVEAVGWRAGYHGETAELVSVSAILDAAQAHQTLMGNSPVALMQSGVPHAAVA